jgi:hypothetical protein
MRSYIVECVLAVIVSGCTGGGDEQVIPSAEENHGVDTQHVRRTERGQRLHREFVLSE